MTRNRRFAPLIFLIANASDAHGACDFFLTSIMIYAWSDGGGGGHVGIKPLNHSASFSAGDVCRGVRPAGGNWAPESSFTSQNNDSAGRIVRCGLGRVGN